MMRSLRMAICTSGDPVSVSWRRYSEMVACLSGMWGIDLWNLGSGRRTEHAGPVMLAGSLVARCPRPDGGSDPAGSAGSDHSFDGARCGPRRLQVGLGRDPQVGLERLEPLGEPLLGLLVGDGGDDDHILPLLPIDRGGDLVVGAQMQPVQ